MTKSECMELLKQSYSADLSRTLLREIFLDSFIPVSNIGAGEAIKKIGTVRRLGRILLNKDTDKAEAYEVLDIETDPKIHIEHNRVSLNMGTKDYFDGIGVRGILAFFHNPQEKAWRLTYAAKSFSFDKKTGKELINRTGTKRYTYVLGPSAATGTAAVRLLSIRSVMPYGNSKHLTEAFSMEAVSKEFFETYRSFYRRFTEALSEKKKYRSLFNISAFPDAKAQESADKPFRDFAKKLLGRLVFLKFLEKKGWLGAKDYAAADGDTEFLNHLYRDHGDSSGNFYTSALVPLFFETLNTKRKGDLFSLTGTKIPFLNGGLFENDYPLDTNRALSFPANLFKELLEFLSSYNFTIDENDPGDADIGVDPDMLGRIFEQLIEDNEKDMNGTIYTPFEVVRFMCRESLVLHLCRILDCDRDSKKAQAVKALIVRGEIEGLTKKEQATLDTAIKTVKVLDPAVGSGAFPMGMLKEILAARIALEGDTADRETLKREIIRNSIYGVDIDHGAVDIARLRFFLSLVVDSKEPEPLPNLDFKLMQGDSLAEEYEGVDLSMESENIHDTKKKKQYSMDFSGKALTRETLIKAVNEFYSTTDHQKKLELEESIRATVVGFIRERMEEENKPVKLDNLEAMLKRNSPFFLWHLFFKDVFDTGGFDIIIGNPPYRANQENENDQAKNKVYPHIYSRIKETFVAKSTAQKTKVYDLFACFFRLAMDFSLKAEKKSIIAFITNYAFIGARTYDGFRRDVRENFGSLRVVNLGGDVRSNQKLSGPVNSIFGIQAGVAISFYQPKMNDTNAFNLRYTVTEEEATRGEKIEFLAGYDKTDMIFDTITPDGKENWVNQSDSDFQSLLPLCSKEAKSGKGEGKTVFELFSLGVVTNRDDWVYDFDEKNLIGKIKYFINAFNDSVSNDKNNMSIKWTRAVLNDFTKGKKYKFSQMFIIKSLYRPFINAFLYYSKELNEMRYQLPKIFPDNLVITISGVPGTKSFSTLAASIVYCLDLLEKTQCLPLYRYEKNKKLDNITVWALAEFQNHYKDKNITKEDIFHYVYAVLHNPLYREKYAIDLKQDYPRIPLYREFKKWAAWGKELMDLHIGFEKTAPHKGITVITAPADYRATKTHRLDYTKDEQGEKVFSGSLTFCDGSGLKGIPPRAFDYKLGNKSAIEWVLDQYVAPSWPTDAELASGKRKIREDEKVLRDKFNTFKFADYREKVIDLIRRLATVSLRTLEIQGMMGEEK
ncbi:DNA modification methylase [Treponema primitia ZAS-2]|uniref:site-specific DNA-methyltransferase (adenine-specific) n=1 Tax=Treponema primitia (strain ATCC BAA-887 / DSM 12427 / ZAS-2) TaxID=545694 RepID=F5YM91_TREPZ|nr:type ISP restriction/modification enzyme [Treponema primitia]AEF86014.1 DNA modification methylase [Treponema primitia ZAS-2]